MAWRSNILANYAGNGWLVILTLACTPIYIKILGVEAFGLIGFFSSLQIWLAVLDFGMKPTMNREMARFSSGHHSIASIWNMLRSVELVSGAIALVILLALVLFADPIANRWLRPEALPTETVSFVAMAMAPVIAFRFMEGLYSGAMLGLQRQAIHNGISIFTATLTWVGAIVVLLFVSSTVEAFFTWQVISGLLALTLRVVALYIVLPKNIAPTRYRRETFSEIRQFAGGMTLISFLALFLTQVDKLLLARLLNLEEYGYYMLAVTIAGALRLVSGPITQSVYPRMVEAHAAGPTKDLAHVFHLGSQLVTVVTTPAVMLLAFFPIGVIFLWTGDNELAKKSGSILSIYILGSYLNALVQMPAFLQMAKGWTSLGVYTNLIAALIIVPALLIVVPKMGAEGAAIIWLSLNCGYLLLSSPLTFNRVLVGEKRNWYVNDLFRPSLAIFLTCLGFSFLAPVAYDSRVVWLSFLSIVALIITTIGIASAKLMREELISLAKR